MAKKKMSSFFKRLLALIGTLVLTYITGKFAKITRDDFIAAFTLFVSFGVVLMWILDLIDKFDNCRERLTWQYFFGGLLIILSSYSWLWASVAEDIVMMWVRLGITFLFSIVGALWMSVAYKGSLVSEDDKERAREDRRREKEQDRWEKIQKKLAVVGFDNAYSLLALNLRYCLVDDSISGGLDFNRPLGVYQNDAPRSLGELTALSKKGVDVNDIGVSVKAYIDKLMEQFKEC